MVSNSNLYGQSIYEEAKEEDLHEDQGSESEPETDVPVRREDVWRELFLTSNGRDKGFKIVQYSLKLYLLFHTSITSSPLLRRSIRRPWEEELVKRLQSAVSGLSFSRKTLLLCNWLTPLTAILSQQAVPFSSEQSQKPSNKTFLQAALYAPPPVLLELVHAISDDVYTISLLGLIGKRLGESAARFSDWCWLLATLVGLVENGVERQVILGRQHQVESRLYRESLSGATAKSKPTTSKTDERELARLQRQDFWLQITRTKLIMDLIFVSYDVFRIKRGRESIKTFAGLAAAILSSAKLFDKHRGTLASKRLI